MSRSYIMATVLMAASMSSLAGEDTEWVTAFDEQFAGKPLERFKILRAPKPGSTSSWFSAGYDKEGQAFSVSGYGMLVRPTKAGAHVVLDVALLFEPAVDEAPHETITELMLMLPNRSMVGVYIRRSKMVDDPATVRLVIMRPGQREARPLREIHMQTEAMDGSWQLRYRHGLLTLRQGASLPELTHGASYTLKVDPPGLRRESNILGNADIGILGVQVVGVSWLQKGGKVVCSRMTLTGEPWREIRAEDLAILKRAAKLNEQSRALFRK